MNKPYLMFHDVADFIVESLFRFFKKIFYLKTQIHLFKFIVLKWWKMEKISLLMHLI